ncbi:hypothetical protein L3Y25_gp066 [Gordonia phage Syleon]|uniref:Uncharacterized protein n=2 Tax=Octobienvirus TaxID=3044779 RepID=A0AAE9C1Z7_9CAUD|nr:hypothetical protein L3Y24_gp065 [Gordonia phage Kudefre]YP_010246725.1 hypothetical protein L3Y25_gp066 [Gordonia phage Syleon]QGH75795.1 hypothetical protein SEA_SYLEON_66 [Gordonia phage Syleon]UDL15295.1 hypothetical protein SEA_KUDEFRE_65 [Gordonia phage Kudefre]
MIDKLLTDIHFQACGMAGVETPFGSREVSLAHVVKALVPKIATGRDSIPFLGSPDWAETNDMRSVYVAALSWALLVMFVQDGQLDAERIARFYASQGWDITELPLRLRFAAEAMEGTI